MSIAVAEDARSRKRFELIQPMNARYAGRDVTLLDLSQSGARVAHGELIPEGTDAMLTVEVPGRSVLTLRARVVWSRRDSSQRLSGLLITEERFDLAADLLEYLLQLRRVRKTSSDSRPLRPATMPVGPQKKEPPISRQLELIPELRPVLQAKSYLERFPRAAESWQKAARETNDEEMLKRHGVEALATWELLNRSVKLELVSFVYELL